MAVHHGTGENKLGSERGKKEDGGGITGVSPTKGKARNIENGKGTADQRGA